MLTYEMDPLEGPSSTWGDFRYEEDEELEAGASDEDAIISESSLH